MYDSIRDWDSSFQERVLYIYTFRLNLSKIFILCKKKKKSKALTKMHWIPLQTLVSVLCIK